MTVEPLLFGEKIMHSDLRAVGEQGHCHEFGRIVHFLPLVDQPFLGRTMLAGWVCSYLAYDVEAGRITVL